MYINKIDDLLDKVIDDFYNTNIVKGKQIDNVLTEVNFVKYQKEINEIITSYIKTIDINEIRKLVQNEDNVNMILEIFKRYIAYYIFLMIGSFYTGKIDTFINNIVEFTKNQISYPLKINNFFNSENNSILIKYFTTIKNVIVILSAEKDKLSMFNSKPEFNESIEFLNSLGAEYVNTIFRIDNKKEQSHNIVKTIIILNMYKKNEKKETFRILETIESEDGEYMFIDVVVPKRQYIDFNSVESVLGYRELSSGMATDFWNYILKHEEKFDVNIDSNDDKLLKLINSKLVVPIVDDFLLYHKDTEKYDKTSTDSSTNKKKEDTKIRYIITKIDTVSEYYSEVAKKDPKVKQNIKKLFYMPLTDRKAILINNNEEIKIINKLINQGQKSIENNEYFNDLLHYRSYPYINFKDFNDNGFSLLLDTTIDAVRGVTYEKTGDHRQNDRNYLQLRTGSKEQIINIIGLMIPTNTRPIDCLKIKDVLNIRSLGNEKNKNGYNLTLQYFQEAVVEGRLHNSSIFWLFDMEKDNVQIDTYEQSAKFSKHEQIKHIVSKLYDDIINEIYYTIVDKLDKSKYLAIDKSYNIIRSIEKKSLSIPNNISIYDDLEEKIYFEKSIKSIAKYDEKEDIFHGIVGDVIELPTIPAAKLHKFQTIRLNVSKTQSDVVVETEQVNGICQHNITWEMISYLRKSNPNKYGDLLYEFIQQYVIENTEQEFICKSCSAQLDIKKYIIDGVYDDDTQKFITFSMPMEVALEDIPEYEKFKISIRNIDKLVEKLAVIVNLPYFIGSVSSIKWRRKAVTKDTIDIVMMNNKYLKKNLKERNEKASTLYGVSRDLSNLFSFDIDNTIFVFSSKEKDHYKNIKHNNILAYIIILIILEINDSHITFMTGDKKGICNFQIFEKFGHTLFDGLKIRKNKAGDLDNIKNYKVLCYLLYIISCMVTKYNMWHFDQTDPSKKKKFNPTIQKIIIHTTIDILNNIIENSVEPNAHYLYEIIVTKFFRKLAVSFNSDVIIKRMRSENKDSISTDRKTHILIKKEPIILHGKFIKHYYGRTHYNLCRLPKYYLPQKINTFPIYNDINNITNCIDGQFHIWIPSKQTMVCKLCEVLMNTISVDSSITSKINENFHYYRLRKIAQKICADDAVPHVYMFNTEKQVPVCIKCNKAENYEYSNKELDNLEKIINEHNEPKIINAEHEVVHASKIVEKIYTEYKKSITKDNSYGYLDNFIKLIQSTMGAEFNLGKNIYLHDNVYIIDHDHNGNNLDTPIILTDKDNKITFKSNHPFFKTDVLFYTNTKYGKTDVFYDTTSLILLGYKENSRDYVLSKRSDKKIIINYSIFNKLKLMGYSAKFINITDKFDELLSKNTDTDTDDVKDDIVKNIVTDIIRDRIHNLKKVVYEFQRFLYKIKNNFIKVETSTASEQIDNKKEYEKKKVELNIIDEIILKYQRKLTNVSTYDENKKNKIFTDWKTMHNEIFVEDISDINIYQASNLLNAEDINKYDNNGNILLYYIVTEMEKLINYNQNKTIRMNIINFYIDFINTVFDMFNTENKLNIFDVKRFMHILKSATYVHDMEQKGHGIAEYTEGIYEEFKDPVEVVTITDEQQDRNDDIAEENGALDVELEQDAIEESGGMDMDNRFDYMSAYDMNYAEFEPSIKQDMFWEPMMANPYD
jgi:hypothetical protein